MWLFFVSLLIGINVGVLIFGYFHNRSVNLGAINGFFGIDGRDLTMNVQLCHSINQFSLLKVYD